jgi:CMP-N-acetylneuraminic acid synthetase
MTNARIGVNPFLYVTPKYESLDIDEPEDWDFAVAAASIQLQKSIMSNAPKTMS